MIDFNQSSRLSFLLELYLILTSIVSEFLRIISLCFLESGVAYISVAVIELCPKKSLYIKEGFHCCVAFE